MGNPGLPKLRANVQRGRTGAQTLGSLCGASSAPVGDCHGPSFMLLESSETLLKECQPLILPGVSSEFPLQILCPQSIEEAAGLLGSSGPKGPLICCVTWAWPVLL
jgi:hypothetical protein